MTKIVGIFNSIYGYFNQKEEIMTENNSFLLHQKIKSCDIITSLNIINQKYLIYGTYNGEIFIYRIENKEMKYILNFNAHNGSIKDILYLGNNIFASASYDSLINIWKIEGKENINCSYLFSLMGHSDSVEKIIMGKEFELISGSVDGTIKFWDLDKYSKPKYAQKLEIKQRNGVTSFIYLKNLNIIISISEDNTIFYWAIIDNNAYLSETIYNVKCNNSKTMIEIPNNRIMFGDDCKIEIFNYQFKQIETILPFLSKITFIFSDYKSVLIGFSNGNISVQKFSNIYGREVKIKKEITDKNDCFSFLTKAIDGKAHSDSIVNISAFENYFISSDKDSIKLWECAYS